MKRNRLPELMDGADLDPQAHVHALRSLNRIDRWFGVHRVLDRAIRQMRPESKTTIVDLGAGGGGFLERLRRRRMSHESGLLVGLDRSRFALTTMQRWYGSEIHCVAADARELPFADRSVDVVTCSLFLHHFDEADVERVLSEAARVARCGLVIGDLIRSRVALVLTWLTTRLTSRSHVFRTDGPLSVHAAFRPHELAAMLERAGLRGAQVRCCFPFRVVIRWRKPGGAHGSNS